MDNADLWVAVDNLLEARQREGVPVVVSKVKGHAEVQDVVSGLVEPQDKYGNDAADTLACEGADQHAVPAHVVRQARLRATVGAAVQNMMIDILDARNAAAFGPAGLAADFSISAIEVVSSSSEGVDDLELAGVVEVASGVSGELVVVSDSEGAASCDHQFAGGLWADERASMPGTHIGLHPAYS